MGWWSQTTEGNAPRDGEAGLAWGDGPADILDVALDEIASAFRSDLGREPTKAELRAGLEFSLLSVEERAT